MAFSFSSLKTHTMVLLCIGFCFGVLFVLLFNYMMQKTDSPDFCGSCHIMSDYSKTLQNGPHAKLSCNDCHAPSSLARKIPFKAAAGAKDIFINTFYDLSKREPTASDATKAIIMENCMRCHAKTNMNVRVFETGKTCWDCHRNTFHSNGLYRAYE